MRDERTDTHLGAGLAIGLVHLDHRPFDLAVVEVHTGVLERIPDSLLKIVEVTTPRIGGIQIELNFKMARKRLTDPPREESADRSAVLSTLAAEERAIAHMPVIPVDARRERQHKPKRGYRNRRPVREGHRDVPRRRDHVRFHGGLAGLAVPATGAVAITGDEAAPSRFL